MPNANARRSAEITKSFNSFGFIAVPFHFIWYSHFLQPYSRAPPSSITPKKYVSSVKDSLRTACMFLMLLAGSAILGHFIAATNIPQAASDWIMGLPVHRHIIMIMICLIYLIGGSFIDDMAFMVLATPIFYPTVLKLGYDPIWFCILLGVTVMIGVVIPPVAICVFVVKNITKTPLGVIYKGVTPFLLAITTVGILLFLFPQIALFLPKLLMPK